MRNHYFLRSVREFAHYNQAKLDFVLSFLLRWLLGVRQNSRALMQSIIGTRRLLLFTKELQNIATI